MSESTSAFVQARQGRFVQTACDHTFVGVNMWYAMHLGMADAPGDRARLSRELDLLQSLGVTNLRIIAASEGPDEQPYRVQPALQSVPGQLQPAVLDGLDYAMSEIAARDMLAVLVLNNFWEWSGGMGAYVAWDGGGAIPYPRDGHYEAFLAYARQFYERPNCQRWYRDHIAALVERVNPYTGRAYRDEPAIFSWQLANEPRYYPQAWIDETIAFLRSLDRNHMISVGSEGEVGGPFRATHASGADYATIHIWPQNWQWFDPHRPETYAEAERQAQAYLAEHVAASRELGLPLVIEEFGMPRDGEACDPLAATTYRDRFFQLVYDAVHGPVRGSNIWAWTGTARPGDRLLGDPYHEPQGWYSVFDSDASTLALIRSHADRLAGRI